MKNWSLIILLLSLSHYAASWHQAVETGEKLKGSSWIEWFSDTFHRLFYVVLMTAIFSCALYNFVRNKLDKKKDAWSVEKAEDMGSISKVLSLVDGTSWNSRSSQDLSVPKPGQSETETQLRRRLKETQEEIQALREELTLSIDSKTELESTIALIDKEKISAEIQMGLERVQGALELEKVKKENLIIRREIQRLLDEKASAVKEVERLERDIGILKRTNVDAAYLEDRLTCAKREAQALEHQFTSLVKEKKNASIVLQDTSLQPFKDDFDTTASWTNSDFHQEYMSLD